MRERNFNNRTALPTKWRWGNTLATPPAYSTGTSNQGEWVNVKDTVTPRYKERIGKGEMINNPFSLVRETFSGALGPLIQSKLNANGSRDYGDLQGLYFPSPTVLPSTAASMPGILGIPDDHQDLITLVGTRCQARVAQASFSGATSLAELTETLRFLANPLKGIVSLAASIEKKLSKRVFDGRKYQPGMLRRRLDIDSSKSLQEEVSSLYLSLMYGMRPLIGEISSVADMLFLSEKKEYSPRETKRSSETRNWQGNLTRSNSESGVSYTETLNYTKEVTVRAGCLYHFLDAFSLQNTNRQWGMRLSDVPAALWAATPSSFVVDWFLNTNEYIQAMTPISGLAIDASWTSVSIKDTLKRTCSNYAVPAWLPMGPQTGGTGDSLYIMERKYRHPFLTVGIASKVDFGSPKSHLEFNQTASLYAMATQRIVPLIKELSPRVWK